jgi:hypothetical protein
MGSAYALRLNDSVVRRVPLLDTALEIHLRWHHYPPLPPTLSATAKEAIHHANNGDWDHLCALPVCIDFEYSDHMSVTQVVETLHLDAFIDYGDD